MTGQDRVRVLMAGPSDPFAARPSLLRSRLQDEGIDVAITERLPRRWLGPRLFSKPRWDLLYLTDPPLALSEPRLLDLSLPVLVAYSGRYPSTNLDGTPEPLDLATASALLRRAAVVVCPSESMARELASAGLPIEQTRVVPPGMPPAGRPIRPPSETGPLRILTVGPLRWWRGLEYLVMAIGILVEGGSSVRLDIVGHGPDRNRVTFAIHDLGLTEIVRLTAYDPEQTPLLFDHADLYVCSAVAGSFPTDLLAAMARGIPVVAADCDYAADVVTHEEEGLLAPPRHAAAMAAALESLARAPQTRLRMGAAGRRRVEDSYSLEAHARAFAGLCADMVERQTQATARIEGTQR